MKFEDDFRKMALDHILSTRSKYYFGLLVIPICVYMACASEVNQKIQVTWLILQWLVGAMILMAIHSANSLPQSTFHYLKIEKLLPTLFMLCGMLWGASAFIFDSDYSRVNTAYLFVLCIGFISAVIIPGILWNTLFYALAIPILVSLLFKLAFEDHTSHLWLALSVIGYIYVIIDGVSKQRALVVFSIEMQKTNEQLIKDLEKQKEIAILANENKTKFLAAASHDLRQPLHAIGLFCETLSTTITNKESYDLVTSIKDAATSSNSYLSAILDISKLDSGAFTPRLQPVNIFSILNKIRSEFSLQAQKKGLKCHVQIDHYWVESDSTFLEIILRNLMSNAVRYTNTGSIKLHCCSIGNRVHISVIDTGIGIPPEHQKDIFREFWQFGNPERDNTKGAGLGLSTVERFCKHLNIDLSLKSKVGVGSKFTLSLACSYPTYPELFIEKNQKYSWAVPNQNILLLENHKDSRIATTQLLKSWGYEVYASESLNHAFEHYISQSIYPDIVLTDFGLSSELNGIDALNILTKKTQTSIVGIILTGESSPLGLEKLKQCNYRILFKPVPAVKLRSAITSASVELDNIRSKAIRNA